jgi:hypothetical protein
MTIADFRLRQKYFFRDSGGRARPAGPIIANSFAPGTETFPTKTQDIVLVGRRYTTCPKKSLT